MFRIFLASIFVSFFGEIGLQLALCRADVERSLLGNEADILPADKRNRGTTPAM